MAGTINLFSSKSNKSPIVQKYEDQLRFIAWIALIFLFTAGAIVGSTYGYVYYKTAQLTEGKQALTRSIAALSVREGLLLALKQRIQIVGNVGKYARPWGGLFPILAAISPAQQYSSLSIDEAGKVTVYLELQSIEEALITAHSVIDLAMGDARQLKNPQLLALIYREDGTVQLGVSFFPIL